VQSDAVQNRHRLNPHQDSYSSILKHICKPHPRCTYAARQRINTPYNNSGENNKKKTLQKILYQRLKKITCKLSCTVRS
jgi:hypothetical protein